ncbi:MAG TPA: helix-turn-helix transcriptional regulator [Pilimelia sp.]|nr:helix-turn-helix transcriptional regulator [Pilimelia sp.]
MISPLVRRRRLGAELLRLRERHGYSSDGLARAVGVSRQRISRLENGHVGPDLDEVMRILDVLAVSEDDWTRIMDIARQAQERGWWEKFADEMGPRQALYANLEAGATMIREYQMTFLPGLLQTPLFTEARVRADQAAYPDGFHPDKAVQARAARQRMLHRPGGPTYEVIIDELAVRRHAAPPDVVAAQLDHLAAVGHDHEKITIRVLPVAARITGHAVPRSAFSAYTYPDDPPVVAVDTATSDLLLTEPAYVARYAALYQRLAQAAMNPLDSLDFLATVAEELSHQTGRTP